MKKDDLIGKDKGLAKLFQDAENGKAPYKIPFRVVDGSYNGCAKCSVAGLPSAHGGSIAVTTKSPATTTDSTTEFSDEEFPDDTEY